MKFLILILAASLIAGCVVTSGEKAPNNSSSVPTAASGKGKPVLVELFTSEGCSSCPPADRLLTTLDRDVGVKDAAVITLAFHVDYWNYLGWKDRFSSAAFSKRQENYVRQHKLDSAYTPQMVIDGTAQFVGSNRVQAIDAISKSSSAPKAAITLSLAASELSVKIEGLPQNTNATVYLAAAESKLFTKVGGGENSGSTLEHTAVVRDLAPIGSAANTTFDGNFAVPVNSAWKKENLKYVVFVQDNATLKILAANQIKSN